MDRTDLDEPRPSGPRPDDDTSTAPPRPVVSDPTVVLVPVLAVVTVLVASTPGWQPLAMALCLLAWAVLTVVWVVRLVRRPPRHRPFWPVVVLPGFLAVVAVVIVAGLPVRARFVLSRDELDGAVHAVLGEQQSLPPTRIGSFPVEAIETDGRAVWFVTRGFGTTERWGIVYRPPGDAPSTELSPVDGDWYVFHEGTTWFPPL